MLYRCYDEPTYRVNGGVPGDPATILTSSVDAALSYAVNYIEIYEDDVLNLPAVITYARNALMRPKPAQRFHPITSGPRGASGDQRFYCRRDRNEESDVRAIGPSLTQFGVAGPLADPVLELHDQVSVIGNNDNWQTTLLGG